MAEIVLLKGQLGQPIDAAKPVGGKPKVDGDKSPEQGGNATGDTEALREKLTAKTVKELIAIAEELKLDKTEYQKLTKVKLVEYIIAKSNNA